MGPAVAGALTWPDYLGQVSPVNNDEEIFFASSLSLRAIAALARDKRASAVRNRLHFSHLAPRGLTGAASRMAPKRGRSGAAGDAVRGRSICLPPLAIAHPGPSSRAHTLALPLPRPVGHAKRLARQLAGHRGSGAAVAVATRLQPVCNSQTIDIIASFWAVARLHARPSRHARVCVYACTRAHICARDAATLQPLNITYINHVVSGCRVVAGRLQVATAADAAVIGAGSPAKRDILASGNAARRVGCCRSSGAGCIRGVMRGLGGESFRVFGLAAGGLGGAAIGRQNGGFLRFPAPRSAHVGRVMLEGLAYPAGKAALSGMAPKPVRLNRETPPGGASSARGGGRPQARARSPRSLTHHVNRIWIGVPACLPSSSDALRWGAAGNWRPTVGPGCGRRSMVGNRGGAGEMAAALNRCGLVTMNRGR